MAYPADSSCAKDLALDRAIWPASRHESGPFHLMCACFAAPATRCTEPGGVGERSLTRGADYVAPVARKSFVRGRMRSRSAASAAHNSDPRPGHHVGTGRSVPRAPSSTGPRGGKDRQRAPARRSSGLERPHATRGRRAGQTHRLPVPRTARARPGTHPAVPQGRRPPRRLLDRLALAELRPRPPPAHPRARGRRTPVAARIRVIRAPVEDSTGQPALVAQHVRVQPGHETRQVRRSAVSTRGVDDRPVPASQSSSSPSASASSRPKSERSSSVGVGSGACVLSLSWMRAMRLSRRWS